MRVQFPEGLQLAVQASFDQHIKPHIKVMEAMIQATLRERGLPLDTKAGFDLVRIDGFDIPDAPPNDHPITPAQSAPPLMSDARPPS